MTSEIHTPSGTLRVEREVIEVTSNAPRTDEAWTYTDERGHEHYWRDGYPTLQWVTEDTYWCSDCDDEHDDGGHWECRECGETVEPGMRPPSMYREFMPGPTSYFLNDEPVTAAQARAFIAEHAA